MRGQRWAHTRQLIATSNLVVLVVLLHVVPCPAAAQTTAACSLAQAVDSGSDSLLPTTHNKQRLIAERANTWAHHFTFQAAVQLDSPPSAFAALRSSPGGGGSSSSRSRPQLVALGDTSGRLYFFTHEGYLLYEHDSGVAAAVLTIEAARQTSNTTVLAVGYGDGTLVLSTLTHHPATLMQMTALVTAVVDTVISTAAEREAEYATRRSPRSAAGRSQTAAAAAAAAGGDIGITQQPPDQQQQNSLVGSKGGGNSSEDSSSDTSKQTSNETSSSSLAKQGGDQAPSVEETKEQAASTAIEGAAVRHIRFMRMAGQQAVLLLEERGVGWVLGRSNGRVRLRLDTPPDPLGLQASDHQAVVIHPQGITITWMRPGRSLIRASCRGLSPTEHGPVVAVAFDTVRKYKAYVLTASGQLLTMVIPFGKQTHICRVVSKMVLGPPAGSVSLHAAHMRLLLVHSQGTAWLSLPPLLATAGALKPLVSTRWARLWGLYGLTAAAGGAEVGGGPAASGDSHSAMLPAGTGSAAGIRDGLGLNLLNPGGVGPAAEVQEGQVSTGRSLQGPGTGSSTTSQQQSGQAESNEGVGSADVAAQQQWVLSAPAPEAFMGGIAGPLVLLPLGPTTSFALFSDGGACGGSDSSSSSGSGGGRGIGGGDGEGINWAKFLQPLLIVMMVVVAVWQFMRASNKSRYTARDSMSGLGRFDPSGFDQDPATARLRALADRLGPGGAGGLDRDVLDRLDARLGRMDGRVGTAGAGLGGGGGGLRFREGAGAAAAVRGAAGGRPGSNGAFRDVPEY